MVLMTSSSSTQSYYEIANRIVTIAISITIIFLAESLYFGNQALAASSNAKDDCPVFFNQVWM